MSSAKHRLKVSPERPSPFSPVTFGRPNLVVHRNQIDSSSINHIRYDFPITQKPKVAVTATLKFEHLQIQIVFAVEDQGVIAPITFVASKGNASKVPLFNLPPQKSDVLIQRESNGFYRVKLELDRGFYFRVNPKDLSRSIPHPQPHQIGIFAAETFLLELRRRIRNDIEIIDLTSFGTALIEHLKVLSSESTLYALGALDFTYYKHLLNHIDKLEGPFSLIIRRLLFIILLLFFLSGGKRLFKSLVDPTLEQDRGISALDNHNYQEAIVHLGKAIELNCWSSSPCSYLRILQARAYEKLGQTDHELETLELAKPLNVKEWTGCDWERTKKMVDHAVERYTLLKANQKR